MKKFISITLLSLVGLLVTSCYYDSEEELYTDSNCDTTNVTFSGTVQPILAANCNVCHSADIASGGVITDNYNGIISHVNSGIFWKAINHEPGAIPMPQNGQKLPACDLDKIKAWINQGAQNN